MKVRELRQIHRRALTAARRSKETLRFYEAAIKVWEEFLAADGRGDDAAVILQHDLQSYRDCASGVWGRGVSTRCCGVYEQP